MTDATRNLLEQHFDTAFAAPDGIAKLRELILTLAMQGKLVEQNPNDPPASELLKEIEKERASREGAKTRRKDKELPPIKPEEVPYELPQGWEWVRLGDITEYNGRNNISGDEIAPDTWLLDLEDIEKGTSRIVYRAKFSERQSKSTKSTFLKGDVLYGKLRPYLDKVIVADIDGVCTTEIVPIVPFHVLNSDFLRWLLKRPAFLTHVNSLMYGVKMPRLGTEDAVMSVHPLPPLPEQHRIVARIDQLMARCDELEKLRKQREEKRLAVHAAAIRQLFDPTLRAFAPSREKNLHTFVPSCEPFAFLVQHIGELYTVKENVTELRKAILQLGIMGRLVPQDAGDPPASELLKEIEAEKQRLSSSSSPRRRGSSKPLPPIKPEEVPYELPQGWEWVRFEEIVDIGSGITKGRKLEGRKLISIPYLRVANVQRSYLDLTEIKEIEIPVEEAEKYLLVSGDLLITEGGDWDKVGRTCIWMEEIPLCGHQNHVFRARKVLSKQNEIWLEKYLNSPTARDYFAGASKQTTNLASINKTQLRGCPIPLPPLPEQHRIVARIDQLMALCDTLDQQIDAAAGKQTELLGAVMACLSADTAQV